MYEISESLFARGKRVMPGGVNSPVRAYGNVGMNPLFIKSAKGSRIVDADGNEYIDYVSSWGPAILGHADETVVQAVREAAVSGLTFGAPTKQEVVLAELITQLVPAMEMIRMVNSGTEAVMSAIRAARGFTGRDYIVKFRGCYHGHSDGLLVKAGSAALSTAVPDSAGVPLDYTKKTLVAEYNDRESVEQLFAAYGNGIAAIIVEPVAANMGVVLPEEGFLAFLRQISRDYGALLIFDEVITGFRLGIGGASGYFQVNPDLITFGKIVGGGMPVGVYGGRRDIMESVSPLGAVYQAGTLSGNPIATAAGIATLTILKEHPEKYAGLAELSKKLAEGLRQIFKGRACVNQVESLLCVFFTDREVVDYGTATASDKALYSKYFCHMISRGIYLAPSPYEAMFVSMAHSEKEIGQTLEAAEDFVQKEMDRQEE